MQPPSPAHADAEILSLVEDMLEALVSLLARHVLADQMAAAITEQDL